MKKREMLSTHLFNFEQFIDAICQYVYWYSYRESHAVSRIWQTEKTMELRYIVDLYLPLQRYFLFM